MNNIQFLDYSWENYTNLRFDAEKKKDQVSKLYYSGLCEGKDGSEFCFVPILKMKQLEDQIESFYKDIKIEDNEVELCNEVYFTSKIEGSKTTYLRTVEIHNGSLINHNDYFSEMMVKGGFEATKFLNIQGNKLNQDILIQMWKILTDGCCDNLDLSGEKYRIGEVGVGNHTGLNHELIEDAMDCWLEFYNSDNINKHHFIKAALLHHAYEFIHPFCDGNGRSGRLLMINYLILNGYEKFKAIAVSKEIARTYNQYLSAFELSDNSYYDCTSMILYILEVFRNTLGNIIYSRNKLDTFLKNGG